MKPKKLNLVNSYKLRRYEKILDKVNKLSDTYAAMTDEELQSKTKWFKDRLSGGESLQDILPEAYATIREAAKRKLGLYPYDVQILGALVMQDNQIAEMRTGEGKTLTAILPLYLNALTGNSAILVTANDYLALRDAKQMKPVFNFLGMTIGVGVSENPAKRLKVPEKQRVYKNDIVYTTHSALGFDYLEENLATSKSKKFLPKFYFCLVDEVDAALLDSAQMPLIISGSPRVQSNLFVTCDEFVKTLKEGEDFTRTSEIINQTPKMVLVTAIANPQRLEPYFSLCVGREIYPDHYAFSRDELAGILARYGATSLLMTQKDYVKAKDFGLRVSLITLEVTLSEEFKKVLAKQI